MQSGQKHLLMLKEGRPKTMKTELVKLLQYAAPIKIKGRADCRDEYYLH